MFLSNTFIRRLTYVLWNIAYNIAWIPCACEKSTKSRSKTDSNNFSMNDDIADRSIQHWYVRANIGTIPSIKRRVRGIFSVRRNTGPNINFYRDQSRGGTIGEAFVVRAPETRILIKTWTAGLGTLCLTVKNHCRANSKISKLVRNAVKEKKRQPTKSKGREAICILSIASVWPFDKKILRRRYR